MAALEIALLGAPTVTQSGKPVSINRNKSMALLAYLALADGPLRRDSLATLLWPDLDQAHARANLRRELAYLRDVLSEAWFTADRETLALEALAEVSVDVTAFRSHVAALQAMDWAEETTPGEQSILRMAEAIALYRGDFLDGFSLRDAPAFDDWQYYTGEELRRKLAWVLDLSLHVQRQAGNLATAQELALRRLAIDPLDEAIHAQLIDLYLSAGNRSAALRQYNRCVSMLERELGVPPSSVLLALGEAVHAVQDATPNLADSPAPQPLDRSQAEIRTILALSLSVLPDTGVTTRKRFDWTTRHVDTFFAACREHLSAAAAHVIYANAESLLAVFGIPASHEDDAERCVLSALNLRNAAEQYEFDVAIGVAAGQAYVRNGGDRNSPAETIMGPVLNLAADVQRAAGRNEVIADHAIFQLTWGVVDYSEAMHITLRGGPVEVHRAHRPRREGHKARGISGLRTQMVGRAHELAMLRGALEQALRGEGQAAFVVGDAGLGKSRLVAELLRSARANGTSGAQRAAHWLTGRCRESTEMIGFSLFAEVIRYYFGWEPGASERERLAALSAGLERLRQQGGLAESQAGEMAAVLGNLCDVRFGDVRDDLLRHADPAQVRYRSIVALTALILAVANEQPLVLVLEDLHWADPASLDLVRSLLAEARNAPLLLLCVYRPGQQYDCSQLPVLAARRLSGHVAEVEVRELSADQVRQLLEGLLRPHRLTFALFERIEDRAQGNPFFAEEIVRSLIDSGQIVRHGGVWSMASRLDDLAFGHAAVTPGIDALVLSRLDRLDPAQRSLLQTAAVLGTSF
ncbi:MAG TPA: AAA family ATPase, partial [Caldilinea sp.]|nr:AAA family ATPase [Caldilinea sp.]